MLVEKLPPVKATLQPSNHPYLNGAWTPQHAEVTAFDLEVIEGEIPTDIDGVYLRNTENQLHQPLGRYHPFDGDGMIHQIDFSGGQANYRNRFVRTRCFQAEQDAGGSLWGGLMDRAGTSRRPGFGAHGGLKDSSSTDIIVHAGKAVSTFYQCGEGYVLDPETLEQEGVAPWVPLDGISAHPKVDPRTGELLFFNYSKHAPFMHYGVVGPDGRLAHYVPVPLPGPRLPHDMMFTPNWSILCDFPLFWDEELLKRDVHVTRLHAGMPSRFALIPRHGQPEEIRWFEADPTFVLHFINAYEDGDEVVLDGYYEEDPYPSPMEGGGEFAHMMAYVDMHSFKPKLHRWRFNLADGTTREERLDDRILEFGMMNQRYLGLPYRYAYSVTSKPGWFLFTGFVKHDLHSGDSWQVQLGEGRYGSEAPFAPRLDSADEDDGYLVSFVTDENDGTSECILIDCKRFSDGPVCRIALPHKISSGTHAHWVERSQLRR
ncbi:MAG: carotenoid oxygenase family protein [Sphingomonadaceae bacterium]|nr:carotenoid oxygenase family protein [Sphingomonadaceae bacterium]